MSPEHDVLEPRVIAEHPGLLRIYGEIDHSTAAIFGDRVRRALADGPQPLRLDLSQVWFFDLAGVRQLLSLVDEGHRITIVGPSAAARMLLELPSLRHRFDITDAEEPPRLRPG